MKTEVQSFTDNRGIIMFTSADLLQFDYNYITLGTVNPGHTRGGHYHKKLHKKILCVSGLLSYSLRKIDEKDARAGLLNPGEIVDVPPEYVVRVYNEEEDVATFVEFKSEEHDENDRFAEEV